MSDDPTVWMRAEFYAKVRREKKDMEEEKD